ncbi:MULTISPECIES: glutathione S-transferase family protein [unclassified Chelatococcus]|uniref:glutathione S-transferase family protein n=1 Tax=unclassified Chelatococcus TaxID=2638111 RepID=UPI001BCE7D89|nr:MULTISPECIES: glutathione S-transferase family protein [unclassified Chelatococcus]MBS7697733.1 glutathione S-transferase family protein [Chelatococcus sp. YT9]MBX3558410.1 glutathione S-transferase family protein [Chelatococcus sp.]
MGMLVEGQWQDRWYDTAKTGGRFERQDSAFRNWVTADGAAGPSGSSGFKAEPGRYHLYVSLACPWAHRTLIFRKLKQLEGLIGLSIVNPIMAEHGWTFDTWPGAAPDTVNGAAYLYEIYAKAKPDYSGRVTVPVLWDIERQTIVNNESAEIIRMFNTAFAAFTDVTYDFCPDDLATVIDETNAFVYRAINNGVYRAGFATTQEAYEEAFAALFNALDTVEERLSRQRYLAGSRLTEADWRLFTTLVRFDAVYVGHFKCNLRRIADYPNLSNYLRELYQVPSVAETVDLAHIKRHYYGSHTTINPTRIVPVGPALDFTGPHDRERLPAINSFNPSP